MHAHTQSSTKVWVSSLNWGIIGKSSCEKSCTLLSSMDCPAASHERKAMHGAAMPRRSALCDLFIYMNSTFAAHDQVKHGRAMSQERKATLSWAATAKFTCHAFWAYTKARQKKKNIFLGKKIQHSTIRRTFAIARPTSDPRQGCYAQPLESASATKGRSGQTHTGGSISHKG